MSKKLTVDGVDYPLNSQQTLLENLEANNVNVEFHCRDGHCGACRCSLVSGQASYPNTPMAYIRDGDVLLCCSHADNDISLQTA